MAIAKKTKTLDRVVLIALGAVGLYVIAHTANQYSKLVKTCSKFGALVINSATLSLVDLSIKLIIKNKSDMDFIVKNQVYDIFFNDDFIGKVVKEERIKVVSNAATDVWLDVRFNPRVILKTSLDQLSSLIFNFGQNVITIRGHYSVASGFLAVNRVNIDESYTIKELLSPSDNPEC